MFFVAGAVGIEPTTKVLETFVIPLHQAPGALVPTNYSKSRSGRDLLLSFFMSSLLAAVLTIFLDFQTRLSVLLVLRCSVVQVMANSAFQIDAVIL